MLGLEELTMLTTTMEITYKLLLERVTFQVLWEIGQQLFQTMESQFNSNINGGDRGIYLLGDTSMEITNSNVKNPSQYGVFTTGDNDVVFDGLTVSDNTGVLSNNYGFYSGQYVTGDISIKNSVFDGMGTSIYFNNDVGTAVENTVLGNGDTGLKIGSQSDDKLRTRWPNYW